MPAVCEAAIASASLNGLDGSGPWAVAARLVVKLVGCGDATAGLEPREPAAQIIPADEAAEVDAAVDAIMRAASCGEPGDGVRGMLPAPRKPGAHT